jgi:hypothetical protein
MSASFRLAALAVAVIVLAPVAANSMEEYLRASSSAPTLLKLCGGDDAPIKMPAQPGQLVGRAAIPRTALARHR